MKKFLNTKVKDMKAITLIALVITIVVLIILAAVAINLSLGNNGIFNRAKTAKEQYQNATQYEQTEVAKSTNQIDSYVGGNRDNISYNYSLDEQVVGTWIDGKPIYQKTIKGVTPSSASSHQKLSSYGFSETNVDRFIDYEGIIQSKQQKWDIKVNSAWGGNQNVLINLNPNGNLYNSSTFVNGEPGIYFHNTSTDYQLANFILTILYTKTTDTATRVVE